MIKHELIDTIPIFVDRTCLPTSQLPELVHMDDPAFSVMADFRMLQPHVIGENDFMDAAINEMKIHGLHLLLVKNNSNNISGILASEDILGEKPIQLIQERRIQRSHITVKMVMTPVSSLPAFDMESIRYARVGNIVATLNMLKQNYALVIDQNADGDQQIIRGIFTTSQISHQLHTNISVNVAKAKSLSELQKRHGKD